MDKKPSLNPFITAPVPPLESVELDKGTSLWKDAWHRLQKNKLALYSGILFVVITLACIVGPWLTPYTQEQQERSLAATGPMVRLYQISFPEDPDRRMDWIDQNRLERRLESNPISSEEEGILIEEKLASRERIPFISVRINPTLRDRQFRIVSDFFVQGENRVDVIAYLLERFDLPERDAEALSEAGSTTDGRIRTELLQLELTDRRHILGTDHLGRDQLTRILQGGRISIGVGFAATFVSLLIGVVYGATAGYFGGKLEALMMRIVDILYALPFLIFVILLMVLFERSIWLLFLAIGAVEWLTMARIVRGQVIGIKKMEFIEAATSLGLRRRRIILRQIIPNVLGTIVVYATLTVPAVMLLEGVLSFLGLGVPPPTASWGTLINEGAQRMETSPWLLLFPGLAFSLTLFCLNFLGDGLRDALDPKSSKD